MTIRMEAPEDYRAVEELTKNAFWNVNYPGCDEHYLAHILRRHPDFVPELDLVVEEAGEIVGNIMFTRAKLRNPQSGEKTVLTFGPLSILPQFQRRGFGKALLKAALEKAAAMGYEAVVIFGNPENYVTSGFCGCKKFDVAIAQGVYPVALLVKELKEGALRNGSWIYAESSAYQFRQEDAEAFDRDFPQMEKGYRYSQELFSIYSRSIVNR